MTLNSQNALWCRKDASFGAYCTNLNDDRVDPYCHVQKCRAMTLVSGNIRCMQIFVGVPLGGGIKWEWVVDDGNFWRFRRLFHRKPQRSGHQYYMTIYYPLPACDWLQNEWPRMTLSGYFMSKSVFGQHFLSQVERLSFKNNCVKSNGHRPMLPAAEM